MTLMEAVNRAARDLPEGYTVELVIGRGEAVVKLMHVDDYAPQFIGESYQEDAEEQLTEEIMQCVEQAIRLVGAGIGQGPGDGQDG